MARYCKMSKTAGKLGSFEGELGFNFAMPNIGASVTSAATVMNPANWAANPTGTHSSWNAALPGAMIASGHMLQQRSDGNVAVIKNNVAQTQYMPVSSFKDNVQKNAAGKIVFACCGYTPAAQTQASAPAAAPASTGTDWASALTGISSILGAVAAPAASIYAAQQAAKAEKDALRRGGGGGGGMPMMMPAPAGGMGAGAIIAIILVVMVMFGGMFMMMNQKAPKAKRKSKRAKRSKK